MTDFPDIVACVCVCVCVCVWGGGGGGGGKPTVILMLCTLYAVWAIQFYKEHIIHCFDIPLPLDRHCKQHTCLRRKLRTVYSVYGVEEDRVTVRASPALTVSFGLSGQCRALFSYDRKTIETRLHYYWKHRLHNPILLVYTCRHKVIVCSLLCPFPHILST